MLHFKGKATFKCKRCGHQFEAFDTEGGIRFGPNLPCCPKCESICSEPSYDCGIIVADDQHRQ